MFGFWKKDTGGDDSLRCLFSGEPRCDRRFETRQICCCDKERSDDRNLPKSATPVDRLHEACSDVNAASDQRNLKAKQGETPQPKCHIGSVHRFFFLSAMSFASLSSSSRLTSC